MTFHINPKGVITRCRAAQGNCPFGGESGSENHFETLVQAKAGYEKMMESNLLPSINKTDEAAHPYGEDYAQAEKAHKKLNSEYWRLQSKIKAGDYTSTEWYEQVQKAKEIYYESLILDEKRRALLPPEGVAKEEAMAKKAAEKARLRSLEWRSKLGAYDAHPEITAETERNVLPVMRAFSGLSDNEIKAKVAEHEAVGLSKTEAYRKVWSEIPLRNDKPLVTIDIETAAPNLPNDRVDTGPLSTIIEVGYIKRWPDGREERKSYLSGAPASLLETSGTGAEHIHNISPEMVKGLPLFKDDKARQEELIQDLKGSVMIAHNARYEINQFSHNLPGFNALKENGHVEVLDTRAVVSFFMPETKDNSNRSLVEATGGVYEGAHRALTDAEMTLEALFKHKGIA